MARIIAVIYLIIGSVTAILDSLDVIQLSLMGYRTNLCALNGDINCVSDGISKMVMFMVDVITWPILLAADFAKLGTIGAIIAVAILWFFLAGKNETDKEEQWFN